MADRYPNRSYWGVGLRGTSRLAVSFTPTANMTVRHWSFVGARRYNYGYEVPQPTTVESATMTWEIRADGTGNAPGTDAASLLATGTLDFRRESAWGYDRTVKYTVVMPYAIEIAKDSRYWFVIKTEQDNIRAKYFLAWFDTYVSGAEGEVDPDVYIAWYQPEGLGGSGWDGSTNTKNLTLYVLDEQAGTKWHCIINDYGYMQPDKMRGYHCEMQQSGLAASRGGQAEYSQLRYPYSNMAQDSWTTGGGQLMMEDQKAFLYALSMDTAVDHQAILGPYQHVTGQEASNPVAYDPATVTSVALPLSMSTDPKYNYRFLAQKIQGPTGGLNMTTAGIRVSRAPWQRAYSVYLSLYSDNAGSPGTLLAGPQKITPNYKNYWQDGTLAYTLAEGTYYWLVVSTDQQYGTAPEFRVWTDQSGQAPVNVIKTSSDGTTWLTYVGGNLMYRTNRTAANSAPLNGTVVRILRGSVGGTVFLFAAAGKKVYKWSEVDQHWDSISTNIQGAGVNETTASIMDLCVFNNHLFVGQGWANNARKWDGTNWTDAGWAAKDFAIGKGFMWFSTAANNVKHTNDGSALSGAIVVGESMFSITAFANYQGKFLVGKEDGIWEVDDQDLAREYLVFREHADEANCKGMCVWSGQLFIPVQSSLWKWQGSQYREVGPTDGRSGPTAGWPSKVNRMVPTAPQLFAVATPKMTGGRGGLMAYNGMGWHYLCAATAPDEAGAAIAVTTDVGGDETRIWYGEGSRIVYVRYPNFTGNRYDWTAADYDIGGGALIHSWWDGGLHDALKFWNRVTLIADVPSGTSIELWAARDGEDWNTQSDMTFLGLVTHDTMADQTECVLQFPDGMVAKSIQLIATLWTTINGASPRIKAINVESIVRQQPSYSYTFRLNLADNITRMDGTTETERTANDMWEELTRSARQNDPIIVSFPFKSIRGLITYLREDTHQFKADGPSGEVWERQAVISIAEA